MILVEKLGENHSLGRLKEDENNIKMNPGELGFEDRRRMELDRDSAQCRVLALVVLGLRVLLS
jgi:hypothetical protein